MPHGRNTFIISIVNLRPYESKDIPLISKYLEHIKTDTYFYLPFYVEIWKDAKDFYLYEGKYGLYLYSKKDKAFYLPFAENMNLALSELDELCKAEELDFSICPITEEQTIYFSSPEYKIERKDIYDEYLYDRVKMETLSGKSLQSKRNHISRFKRENPEYSIRKIEKKDFPTLIELAKMIVDTFPEEMHGSLSDEFSALKNALCVWDEFHLDGLLIEVEGKVIAYTIVEKMGRYAIIHFEKAIQEITGAYQTINQEFVKTLGPEIEIINRQEDLGLDGLRKAKLSYKPIDFIKKYSICKN